MARVRALLTCLLVLAPGCRADVLAALETRGAQTLPIEVAETGLEAEESCVVT